MTIFINKDEKYSILDLGYTRLIVKSTIDVIQNDGPVTPEMANLITGGVASKNLLTGELISSLDMSSSGLIRSGQTAYNTGIGFFLGYSTDAYKFSIGNPASDYFIYDGTSIKLYSNTADGFTLDYGSNMLLKEGGNIKFTSVTAPGACTATLIATGTGNVDNGTHTYKVTFVNATGETSLGTASNTVTVDASNKQVALSAIPVSSSGSVTARKIYRTKAGGTSYLLLATISDNTTTTYTDNSSDNDLGQLSNSANNRENTTFGKIIIDNSIRGSLGSSNIFLGGGVANSNTVGYLNTVIGTNALYSNTSGLRNVAIGEHALYSNTSGYLNVAVGASALYYRADGWYNTAIGASALYSTTNGIKNVAIGFRAGFYETGDNKLFIDNDARAGEADARTKALIYGVFDASPANQKLTINAVLNVSEVIKMNDVQVVSNRVIDTRCDDAINSGDATTDGVIDALRDAMIAHGLIAAA